jgi:hypothetical protein
MEYIKTKANAGIAPRTKTAIALAPGKKNGRAIIVSTKPPVIFTIDKEIMV